MRFFNVSTKNEKKLEIISCFLVLLMFLTAYYKSFSIFIVFMIISLLVFRKREIIINLLFVSSTVPTFFILPESIKNNFGIGRIIGLMVLFYFIIDLLIDRAVDLRLLWILLIITIMNSFSTLFSYDIISSFNIYLMLTFHMGVFFALSNMKLNFCLIRKLLSLSSFLLIIFFAYIFLSNLGEFYGIGISISKDINKNRFAMGLVITGIISFFNIYENNFLKRMMFFVSYLLDVYILFLSGSRTATIALLLGSFVYFVYMIKNNKIMHNIYLVFVLFLIIIIIFVILSNSTFYENIIERYALSNMIVSKGAFRLIGWENDIKYVIPNNLLLGTGLGSVSETKAQMSFDLNPVPAHNIIISLISQVGVIGFILYIILFVYIFLKVNKPKKTNDEIIFFIFILISIILNGIGESIFSERSIWLISGLLLGATKSNETNVIATIN